MNLKKEICKSCMRVERTAPFEENEQIGPPCPWDRNNFPECLSYDSDRWNNGNIHCPHKRQEISMLRITPDICLRAEAQQSDILIPEDEVIL